MKESRPLRLLSFPVFLGGCAILVISVLIDYFTGQTDGATQNGQHLFGYGYAAIDVVSILVMGLAAGGFFAYGCKKMGTAAAVALILGLINSAQATLSYTAIEQMSAAASRKADIMKDQWSQALVAKHVDKLSKAAANLDATKSERRDLNNSVLSMIRDVKGEKSEVRLSSYAIGELMSKTTGVHENTVMASRIAFFTLVLKFLEAVCFPMAGYMFGFKGPARIMVSANEDDHEDIEEDDVTDLDSVRTPSLRAVPKRMHVDAMVSALQSLGVSGQVPHATLAMLYPPIMQASGIKPMRAKTFFQALREVHPRKRLIMDQGHDAGRKVTTYYIPPAIETAPEATPLRPARAHNLVTLSDRRDGVVDRVLNGVRGRFSGLGELSPKAA